MSEKLDPITNFLAAHRQTLSKTEQDKLKDRVRHRKSYAQKTTHNWKEHHAETANPGLGNLLRQGVQPVEDDD